jgi:hypothetical protein
MKVLKWIAIGFIAFVVLMLLIPSADAKEEVVSIGEITTIENEPIAAETTVDSAKIKELKGLFTNRKDEFSENKTEWITPKAAPAYRNSNGIYCYFSENNLRFVYQFHSDDWLFIKEYKFLIDDKPYSFKPDETKRDNDETGITEWFDIGVSSYDGSMAIVEALANAKTAKVKLVGDNYVEVKNISTKQLNSIKNTLAYFKARGNKLR